MFHSSLSYLVYTVLNDTCSDSPADEQWTLVGAFADGHTASVFARNAAIAQGLVHRVICTAEGAGYITVYRPYSAKE